MRNRRGQSTLELALTIVAVAAAAIAMSIFMKRSVMGKMRDSGDQVGGQFTPTTTTNNYTRTFNGSSTEQSNFDGSNNNNVSQSQNRTGKENVNAALTGETLYQ